MYDYLRVYCSLRQTSRQTAVKKERNSFVDSTTWQWRDRGWGPVVSRSQRPPNSTCANRSVS